MHIFLYDTYPSCRYSFKRNMTEYPFSLRTGLLAHKKIKYNKITKTFLTLIYILFLLFIFLYILYILNITLT